MRPTEPVTELNGGAQHERHIAQIQLSTGSIIPFVPQLHNNKQNNNNNKKIIQND